MNNLKEINIENRTCYYYDDIIRIEDFDFDNSLLDEKSYMYIFWFMAFHRKLRLVLNHCVLGSIK